MEISLENSHVSDLAQIVEIYNWAIINTTATFDTKIKTVESQFSWYQAHNRTYPIIVAKREERVIGWGSISRWSDRCAYDGAGEVSFYVDPDFHGFGVGSKILNELILRARASGFRTLLSRIAGNSNVSIHLHKKMGFSDVGTMKNVGFKFGEILDVHIMQILF